MTFTESEAYTAMCLWEAFLEDRDAPDAPWAILLRNYGTHTARDTVLSLAKLCEADWEERSEDERDSECFDWDFCPRWLRNNWHRHTSITGE